MSRYLLATILIFLSFCSFAQPGNKPIDWLYIDSSITNSRNLLDIKELVQKTKYDLLQQKNYLQAARCFYYEIKIADKRTEDSLYFHNSAIYDSLLMTTTTPRELQLAIHLLQAKRLSGFSKKNLKFKRDLYEDNRLSINYAKFSNDQLDSIAIEHYEMAGQLLISGHNYSKPDALWFSSDPLLFLFPPDFFDVIIAEEILLRSRKFNYYYTFGKRKENWSMLTPDEYITRIDSMQDKGQRLNIFSLYSTWLKYHHSEKEKYYFIETLARKYFESSGYYEDYVNADYEAYLINISQSPYPAVKAHGVYQLCLYWNKLGNKYFSMSAEDLRYRYYRYSSPKIFDTTWRYHLAKSMKLYEQNRNLMDSFSYLDRILKKMESQIRKKELNMIMELISLPGQPILSEMVFKNTDSIYYQVFRTNYGFEFNEEGYDQKVQKIRNLQLIRERSVVLPHMTDFNRHAAYLSIDSLPIGHYFMLFSYHPLTNGNKDVEFFKFQVSSLAVVDNNNQLLVLDRRSGKPIKGARVRGSHLMDKNNGKEVLIEKQFTTNERGLAFINDKRLSYFDISYNGDSVFTRDIIDEEYGVENIYDKKEYDDLVEFYEDNAEAYVYTDRAIYRPGQTVHYKLIFLTRHATTGEPILMSPKNIGNSLFKRVYKKWLKDSEPYISISDPFSKEVDSVPIRLNEFGTFSATFKIPKTAATGDWDIDPYYIDAKNETSFRVEEYKRPTYELKIEGPQKQLLPGDPVSYKVNVRSFAGGQLNNVELRYFVVRTGAIPGLESRYIEDTIASDVAYSNENGELEVKAIDTFLTKLIFDEKRTYNFRYFLQVEVVDKTGESYTGDHSVNVSSRPISIRRDNNDPINLGKNGGLFLRARDANLGYVDKKLKVDIYKKKQKGGPLSSRELIEVDSWVDSKTAFIELFPRINFNNEKKEQREFITSLTVNTKDHEKILLDTAIFSAGEYIIDAECVENGKIIGKNELNFSLFDDLKGHLPSKTFSFKYLPMNSFKAGDTLKFYNGNSEGGIYSIWQVRYYKTGKKTGIAENFEFIEQPAGLNCWSWKIPKDAKGEAKVFQVYIFNNEFYRQEAEIFIGQETLAGPEIIIEKYRKKLAPGATETFSLSVKTNNTNVAAELMTTLYDASLDKLEVLKWTVPSPDRFPSPRGHWSWLANVLTGNNLDRYPVSRLWDDSRTSMEMPLWWVDPFYFTQGDVMADWNSIPGRRSFSVGFFQDISGDQFENLLVGKAAGLDEVVVVGYGSTKRQLAGSVAGVTIRGNASLSTYRNSNYLIILDGVPYEGDLSKIDPTQIVDGLVLKGAEATAIFGSRAAQGVLVLSTKGNIVLPGTILEPPPPARKNFNELAFFFPAVHADRNGYYNFTFTMPESVTEWNWKMLAHTKLAAFAYAERKLNTQLPLMVQPNVPRVMYQGDRIVVQCRISNLDSVLANGVVSCKVEDLVTGEDISSKLLTITQKNYAVEKRSTSAIGFELTMPDGQINPVKFIVHVRSGSFADGEEHIIPVLSPKVFVRQVQPFYLLQKDSLVNIPSIPQNVTPFGVGLSIRPKPRAALINSLPYLAEYNFDCAEQVTNKIRALLTATQVIRKDTGAQRSYANAKLEVEKGSQPALPGELSQETMPWLRFINHTSLQQQRLLRLFDSSRTLEVINGHLNKLYKLQNPDGGLSWFPGGRSNLYMSQYVLGSFGQLKDLGMLQPKNVFDVEFDNFIEKILNYCDSRLLDSPLKTDHDMIDVITSRLRWNRQAPVGVKMQGRIDSILVQEWKSAERYPLSKQAPLILASLLNAQGNSKLMSDAVATLRSIAQLAIDDDQNGVRWKELADAEYMSGSAEETLAILTECFKLTGSSPSITQGIIKWLTNSRTDEHWGSTKATAAVVNLLQGEQENISGPTTGISATVNNTRITVNNDLLSGSLFDLKQLNEFPLQVKLEKSVLLPVSGNLIWYYFGTNQVSNNGVNVKKVMHKLNRESKKWDEVTEQTSLRIADHLRITLEIETPKALQYVYIDDKRGAGLEPLVNNSGYEYGGFGYYRSVRDAGLQFFADHIPAGRYTITYEVKVAHEGNFMNGPASLQCMYRPDLNAVSNGVRVRVDR
jgi:hypothetical protein